LQQVPIGFRYTFVQFTQNSSTRQKSETGIQC
jgi:hypothetical protein